MSPDRGSKRPSKPDVAGATIAPVIDSEAAPLSRQRGLAVRVLCGKHGGMVLFQDASMDESRLMSASSPVGAETYSSAMADAKNYISWILASFSGYLASPVLEIGVGHGSYAGVLHDYGDYIGVDI